MAFVDDRQLLELSITPRQALFPVLDRAEAMSSLIVLLAIIPPLYVFVNRTVTPLDALNGIKAVRVSQMETVTGWLDPYEAQTQERTAPLPAQPPLSTWMIAGTMRLLGTDHPWSLAIMSFFSTTAIIVLVFALADRLRGPQFAWWSALFTATSGPILQGAQTAVPVSLTLACTLGAIHGFVAHTQDAKRLFSGPLLTAGFAWGLCWLAGGMVALMVLAVIGMYAVVVSRTSRRKKRVSNGKTQRKWRWRPAILALGVFLLVGLLVGGWWTAWMTFRHGTVFLHPWAVGVSLPADDGAGRSYLLQFLQDAAQMGGLLTGLIILGFLAILAGLRRKDTEAEQPQLVLMLAWGVCAGVMWLVLRAATSPENSLLQLWRGFLLLPLMLFAAFGMEQIVSRQIRYRWVMFAVIASGMFLALVPPRIGFGLETGLRNLWSSAFPSGLTSVVSWSFLKFLWKFSLVGIFLSGVFWTAWKKLGDRDSGQRRLLGAVLVVVAFVHAAIGFWGVRRATLDDQLLANMREELLEVSDVSFVTLVSEDAIPPRLRFSLTALWPSATWQKVDSWWDPSLTKSALKTDATADGHFLVEWNDRDIRVPTLRMPNQEGDWHLIEFLPVGTPRVLWDHRLRVFRLTNRVFRRELSVLQGNDTLGVAVRDL